VKSQLEVVVVGGGIGGLFAANALTAHGIRVLAYEQAPALGEIGAGVFLTPNSVRQLQRVGLGSAVQEWGARVGPGSHYFRNDGAPIAPVQVTDSSGWNATFGMHRADLVEFLARALPTDIVHTGHRCTGFVGATRAITHPLAQGAEERADAELRQQLALAEQQLADLKTALDDMRSQRDAWQTMAQARIRPAPASATSRWPWLRAAG